MEALYIKLGRIEKSLFVMENKVNEATALIRKEGEENQTPEFMAEYEESLQGWYRMKFQRDQVKAQIKAAA